MPALISSTLQISKARIREVGLADLNQKALAWSTVRMEQRPQGKAELIPAKAFEHERGFLQELPRSLMQIQCPGL